MSKSLPQHLQNYMTNHLKYRQQSIKYGPNNPPQNPQHPTKTNLKSQTSENKKNDVFDTILYGRLETLSLISSSLEMKARGASWYIISRLLYRIFCRICHGSCPSVRLAGCLSVCQSVCLSLWLAVCLSGWQTDRQPDRQTD